MPYKEVMKETKIKMQKAYEHVLHEFAAVRTGKATPALVEDIKVDYYGSLTPMKEIAGITTPEPRMIVIQPWDQTAVKAISKAIQTSSLGISPVDDGRIVRVPIPELTESRRKDLDRHIKQLSEEGRIGVRNVRREEIDKFKKMKNNKELTEDDLRDAEKEVQGLTDKVIEQINQSLKDKEKEIFTI